MKRITRLLILGLIATAALACNKPTTAVTVPTFSDITVTPAQDTYHVGDTVTCTIRRLTLGSDNLQSDQYWFYAGWWFSNPELTADFQEFGDPDADGIAEAVSSPIVLTEAGEVRLYFFGKLEYPCWEFRKIEIPVTLNVVAQ